jgi:hypothetical protein
MRDILVIGTVKIIKVYISIQLIQTGTKSMMDKEHDGSHFLLTTGGST